MRHIRYFLIGVIPVTLIIAILVQASPKKHHLSADPKSLFDYYNETYFLGQLPNAEVVEEDIIDSKPNHVFMADTEHALGGHWYKIRISPTYNPTLNEEVLSISHESCHILIWERYEKEGKGADYQENHGTAWQNCMLNLAEQGAFKDVW